MVINRSSWSAQSSIWVLAISFVVLWVIIHIGHDHYDSSSKLFDNEIAILINYAAIVLSFPACAVWWAFSYIMPATSPLVDMYAYTVLSILQWMAIVIVVKQKQNKVSSHGT